MASAVNVGAVAAAELVEHDVERAEVRGVGPQQQRLAGDADRVGHARHLAGHLLDVAASPVRVRSAEAPSGSCTFTSR